MSADNGSSASQDSTTSGAQDESTAQTQTHIKPEDHLRAIEDLKKFKARSRELEASLAQIQSDLEESKNKKLTEANDFKSLYEQASTKNKDWESRYQKLKENVVYNEKYKAAQTALISAGIRKDALKILDKEDFGPIVVEHTSEGRMLVNGIEEYVDTFKKNYGFAFEQKQAARVNGSGGSTQSMSDGSMTMAKVIELQRKHGNSSAEATAALAQYLKNKKS